MNFYDVLALKEEQLYNEVKQDVPALPVGSVHMNLSIIAQQGQGIKKGPKPVTKHTITPEACDSKFFVGLTAKYSKDTCVLESKEDYDKFVGNLYDVYTQYAVPMLAEFGKLGDRLEVEAEIDKEFGIKDGYFQAKLCINIPNECKKDSKWIAYLITKSNYKKMIDLHANFTKFEMIIRDHLLQSVVFYFRFKVTEPSQSVASLYPAHKGKMPTPPVKANGFKTATTKEEMRTFWIQALNDVQEQVENNPFHSYTMRATVVEHEHNDATSLALELEQLDIKIKVK